MNVGDALRVSLAMVTILAIQNITFFSFFFSFSDYFFINNFNRLYILQFILC
jgi:hypothetical protein